MEDKPFSDVSYYSHVPGDGYTKEQQVLVKFQNGASAMLTRDQAWVLHDQLEALLFELVSTGEIP